MCARPLTLLLNLRKIKMRHYLQGMLKKLICRRMFSSIMISCLSSWQYDGFQVTRAIVKMHKLQNYSSNDFLEFILKVVARIMSLQWNTTSLKFWLNEFSLFQIFNESWILYNEVSFFRWGVSEIAAFL